MYTRQEKVMFIDKTMVVTSWYNLSQDVFKMWTCCPVYLESACITYVSIIIIYMCMISLIIIIYAHCNKCVTEVSSKYIRNVRENKWNLKTKIFWVSDLMMRFHQLKSSHQFQKYAKYWRLQQVLLCIDINILFLIVSEDLHFHVLIFFTEIRKDTSVCSTRGQRIM